MKVVLIALLLSSCSLVRLGNCDDVSYVRHKSDVEVYARCKV